MIGPILEYSFAVMSMIGSYYVGDKNIKGLYWWFVADVLGIGFGLFYHHWAFTAMSVGYTVLVTRMIIKWRRDERHNEASCVAGSSR